MSRSLSYGHHFVLRSTITILTYGMPHRTGAFLPCCYTSEARMRCCVFIIFTRAVLFCVCTRLVCLVGGLVGWWVGGLVGWWDGGLVGR